MATVTEGFSTAFQNAAGEGADTSGIGTRLLLRVSGLPINVRIYAPEMVVTHTAGGTLTLVLVFGADGNGAGGAPLVAPASGQTDLLAAGTTTIVYETTADSDALTEAVRMPLGIFTTGTPSAGTATVSAALAPISTVGTSVALATAPIPRFADVPLSGATFTTIICSTNILFPYVANQFGFDTGFAIANTTSDAFGTTSQTGTCTYNFFGTNAPAGGTFTTPAFSGGTVDTRLLSVMAPGFSGYVIVVCNFQLGHAFAFLAYQLGTTAAVTWTVEGRIILQHLPPGLTRQGMASSGPPFGESLGF
ncbi:MAG: hypothetical protein HY648_01565 [Acidobacteria bacterium]|nr:hypothetical protein [Acidobacteriota bacterium]